MVDMEAAITEAVIMEVEDTMEEAIMDFITVAIMETGDTTGTIGVVGAVMMDFGVDIPLTILIAMGILLPTIMIMVIQHITMITQALTIIMTMTLLITPIITINN